MKAAKQKGAIPPPNEDLLDMEEVISLLKTTRPTFYRWLRAGRIKGLKAGRQWRFRREDVDRFIQGEQPRIELLADIRPVIATLGEQLAELAGGKAPSAPGDPVAQAVDLMTSLALALRATDLHLEPQTSGRASAALLRYRIDGVLHTKATIDIRLLPPIVEEWKKRAQCDLNEKNLPQDGRIVLERDSHPVDMRLCFVPTVLGESVTIRVQQLNLDVQFSLDRLPYTAAQREILRRSLQAPWGMILCTGPTGSGKTTTLYSCLTEVTKPERKVVSCEDPVEFPLPGVMQVQLNAKAGVKFVWILRAFLRCDPDVIMVGEIRDAETLNLCMQAALTGHLVLTTLHTDDAVGTLLRMIDIGAQPFLAADATKLIVAQRLVRQLCPHCSVPGEPSAVQIAQAIELAKRGGIDFATLPRNFKKPAGCPKCGQTGYRGRTLIAELLEITPDLATALRRGAGSEELRTLAVRHGMRTMAADGIAKAAEGLTTLDEVLALRPGG